jgi:hypothetical protein
MGLRVGWRGLLPVILPPENLVQCGGIHVLSAIAFSACYNMCYNMFKSYLAGWGT